MKLSQTDASRLNELTKEQVDTIVFGNYQDDGGKGDAALLLGSNPIVCKERAAAAAQLYHAGRVPYIIPTGGVLWETEYGTISEACFMKKLLQDAGVPESAIILENEARTTDENMVFGTVQILRELKIGNVHRVYIVTSYSHLRRSLAFAKLYLPRSIEIAGYCCTDNEDSKERWQQDEFYALRVQSEVRLLKKNIDLQLIDDIEY